MVFDRRPLFGALFCLTLWSCQAGPAPASSPDAPSSSAKPSGDSTTAGSILESTAQSFLSMIPIRASDKARAAIAASTTDDEFARALRVRLELMRGYKDAGELSRRAKLPVVNGTLQISDLAALVSRDTPTKGDQKSSFVIDYDEKSFEAPVAELERSGKSSSPASISAFVASYISEKSYARSFDVASRVASTRSGDCTEHAVLTAALLRRFGFRSRVIFGIVLVGVGGGDTPPSVQAFGHAWVEQHDKDHWQIIDAALGGPACASGKDLPTVCGVPAGVSRRLAYLPLNVLKDETASFGRALMDEVGVESVVRVEVDVSSAGRGD